MRFFLPVVIAMFFVALPAEAALKLPSIISDGMVLQRDRSNPIWGTASKGEPVTVIFGDEKVSAIADQDGNWKVKLPALQAGGPYTMTVKTQTEETTIKNVMIGEVWLMSGQSNMGMTLGECEHDDHDIQSTNLPKIHLYQVPKNVSPKPLKDVQASWVECEPKTAEAFSAIGIFFGKELYENLKMPIGLIDCCYAGSTITTWASEEGWNATPELRAILARSSEPSDAILIATAKYQKDFEAWGAQAEIAKSKGEKPPPKPLVPTASLWNGMVNPFVPYGLRGVCWYQGESDTGKAQDYAKLFPALIQDWRKHWGRPDLPILFVQLPNFAKKIREPVESGWAELRESQMQCRRIPFAYAAVSMDTAKDEDVKIHPKEKKEIAHRLALIAMATQYKLPKAFCGPIFDSVEIQGDRAKILFRYADSGLVAKGGALRGFEVAGADRKFFWADAKIVGSDVFVHSDKVKEIVAVRYAWADNPWCTLYNADDLPAAPFRTDHWSSHKVASKKQ
jgi:sialate O-acetylesterase